jgi:hypothetical protein
MGAEDVQTVPCDTTALTCSVKVPAPGFALVFLSDAAETETLGAPSTTFKTTALTRTQNTGASLVLYYSPQSSGVFFAFLLMANLRNSHCRPFDPGDLQRARRFGRPPSFGQGPRQYEQG